MQQLFGHLNRLLSPVPSLTPESAPLPRSVAIGHVGSLPPMGDACRGIGAHSGHRSDWRRVTGENLGTWGNWLEAIPTRDPPRPPLTNERWIPGDELRLSATTGHTKG